MTEYDADFGMKLAEASSLVLAIGGDTQEAMRVVVYISLLSMEISLKAMLERAGRDHLRIRSRSHRLSDLSNDLCGCEVEVEIVPGSRMFVSAARLRSNEVAYENTKITVGRVLNAEKEGASIYPNEVRYGESFSHFPPSVLVGTAKAIATFAKEHWASLRVKA